MDDYKKLIDSTELQKTVLNFIGSEEFNKMVNCSIFKDNQECKSAIIYGMSIASMLVCDCTPFYIKFNEETDEDDNRPQCCIDPISIFQHVTLVSLENNILEVKI